MSENETHKTHALEDDAGVSPMAILNTDPWVKTVKKTKRKVCKRKDNLERSGTSTRERKRL